VSRPSRFRRWVDRVNAPPPEDEPPHVPYDHEYLESRRRREGYRDPTRLAFTLGIVVIAAVVLNVFLHPSFRGDLELAGAALASVAGLLEWWRRRHDPPGDDDDGFRDTVAKADATFRSRASASSSRR
jgi:hypothetical protein